MDLKRYRRENGISTEQLCKKLGVKRNTLGRWECGLRFPKPEMVLKIKEVTNGKVTSEDLLSMRKK